LFPPLCGHCHKLFGGLQGMRTCGAAPCMKSLQSVAWGPPECDICRPGFRPRGGPAIACDGGWGASATPNWRRCRGRGPQRAKRPSSVRRLDCVVHRFLDQRSPRGGLTYGLG
jgi:hypothetical protein